MAQVIVFAFIMLFGINWLLNTTPPSKEPQPCVCDKLPENYTVIETNEKVICLNQEREYEVERTIKSAKVERN